MPTPFRKMKPYHPRKSSKSTVILKQELSDLEHKIAMGIGNYLVLIEEGTPEQATLAQQKGRSDLLKYGPEMLKIAQEIGGKFPQMVHDFLESIDSVLHSASGWIDEAKVLRCYHLTQTLEKELQAA